jgi:2-dehydro-3-deoxygalactonokinase
VAVIACIVADWGTTNLRAWALDAEGGIVDRRESSHGLLTIERGRFAEALAEVASGWLPASPSRSMPVLLSGMVGSKLGWKEVPYLALPMALDELARHVGPVESPLHAAIRIVPGVKRDDAKQPDVMRGEETQIFGALQILKGQDGVFVLPGTHSKWAIVEKGKLISFRTYMTGEVFGLLRRSGTLSQLMEGDHHDDAAFAEGVARGASADAGGLLHRLFSVRTLGLLDQMPRANLASYLSGLLIGAEVRDGLAWLRLADRAGITTGIGSPAILESYRQALRILSGADLAVIDSGDVVPPALFSIARAAGLLTATSV